MDHLERVCVCMRICICAGIWVSFGALCYNGGSITERQTDRHPLEQCCVSVHDHTHCSDATVMGACMVAYKRWIDKRCVCVCVSEHKVCVFSIVTQVTRHEM